MSESADASPPRSPGKIHILRESVARKIAAGEVIERPFSVVRELLDNAIDAGADRIELHLQAGGLESVRVVDNGAGMTREDLELCWQPHATSKIQSENDLAQVRSLGFRGEALSSMAAVSRLEISSTPEGAETGHTLRVAAGKQESLESARPRPGTTVEVRDLFYTMPARKRFMKRPAAETAMGRTVFVEKALPFPDRAFRLFTDGDLKLFLPPAGLAERVATAFSKQLHPGFLHTLEASGESFSARLVLGTPELARRDRKLIQIFVNGRRVWEYSLVQAAEYAYSEVLPGGSFPVAFVFLEMQPEYVDFNVHPAKKEARFKDLGMVHHRLVRAVREFLKAFELRTAQTPPPSPASTEDRTAEAGPGAGGDALWSSRDSVAPETSGPAYASGTRRQGEAPPEDGRRAGLRTEGGHAADRHPGPGPLTSRRQPSGGGVYDLDASFRPPQSGEEDDEQFRYVGQLFGVFLLAEHGGRFYIVDQHAGHERVLFDRLRRARQTQRLLVPEEFEPDEEQRRLLEVNRAALEKIGVELVEKDGGVWELRQVPASCIDNVRAVIDTAVSHPLPAEELERSFYAHIACRAAIKDGDEVDDLTARSLLREVFALENARCPHGRPIWHELTREHLFGLVGRT